MFTGIIQSVGKVQRVQEAFGDCRLYIDCGTLPLDEIKVGDSIAVNGVCLTAVETGRQCFTADVSQETLGRTTLRESRTGIPVNLELALTPSTRMGGHIVSGHIDGMGVVKGRHEDGRSFRFAIEVPKNLAKYIAEKGSVCVDGVSLTVNQVEGLNFDVNIVPHTMSQTTFGFLQVGQPVNLEIDLLARYLERLLLGEDKTIEHIGIIQELLNRSGFSE